MHDDLVDRVQDEREDENVPHIAPRLPQQLAPAAWIRENGPQEGGPAFRASCKPARIAKKTATAGWRISRNVIGPSERPMRFSHPRLSASSTIHLPVGHLELAGISKMELGLTIGDLAPICSTRIRLGPNAPVQVSAERSGSPAGRLPDRTPSLDRRARTGSSLARFGPTTRMALAKGNRYWDWTCEHRFFRSSGLILGVSI